MALLCSLRSAPACSSGRQAASPFQRPRLPARQLRLTPAFSADPTNQPTTTASEGLESEAELKRKAAEKLRAAEKFLVVGDGSATCTSCNYEYRPEKGDLDFPIPAGVKFSDLPADYFCPTCGAPKDKFRAKSVTVAGFAENQGYGLGTNSWTESQKLGVIYGALGLFFLLFLGGYALE